MKEEVSLRWRMHDDRIKPYVWSHRVLGLVQFIIGFFFLGWILFDLRGKHLEWMLNGAIASPFFLWLAYFGIIALFWDLLTFPFSLLGYRIDRKYGLSNPKCDKNFG